MRTRASSASKRAPRQSSPDAPAEGGCGSGPSWLPRSGGAGTRAAKRNCGVVVEVPEVRATLHRRNEGRARERVVVAGARSCSRARSVRRQRADQVPSAKVDSKCRFAYAHVLRKLIQNADLHTLTSRMCKEHVREQLGAEGEAVLSAHTQLIKDTIDQALRLQLPDSDRLYAAANLACCLSDQGKSTRRRRRWNMRCIRY
jgi:hypothetical protein